MGRKGTIIHLGKKTLNLLLVIGGIGLHLVSFWVLYRSFLPVARWYWEAVPIRGVDLLNASSYVSYLSRNFAPLHTAWKYIWFGGEPFVIDYPNLHFYLALPLVEWLTPIRAIQLWMLVSTFLFFVFSYLLYARLSRSRAFALVLGILTVYSVSVYGALIWGGSIPYYGTQVFLPLTLYLLVLYLQTGKRRWFAGAILALGISQYGHPQVVVSYGMALSGLSLVLAPRIDRKSIRQRISDSLLFVFLVVLIGFPVTGSNFDAILEIPLQISSGLAGEIPVSYQATKGPDVSDAVREFYSTRIYQFYTDTHPWLFWIALLAVVVFLVTYFASTFLQVLTRRRKRTVSVFFLFWATVLLGYVTFYHYLYSVGIDLFHGGWYRVFWPVPVLVGMVASVAFGYFGSAVSVRRDLMLKVIWLVVDGMFVAILVVMAPRFFLGDFENTLFLKSTVSGGFPGKVLVSLNKTEQDEFRRTAVPEWLPVDSRDYRLYSADQTYNMWFNAFYDLPLARGYIDPPVNRWGIFLTDILLDKNVAVEEFDYPEEVAKNATRSVLSWNAIGYLADWNQGPGAYVVPKLSSYITDADSGFISRSEVWETMGSRLGKPSDVRKEVYIPDIVNGIRYSEVKRELVDPILSLNNAPAVLFVGDESYWEIFIRTLVQMGLTSRELVPVKGPKFLDKVKFNDLSQFDGVVLYGYDYKNHEKAWSQLERYVESGGNLLVDTGAEVKESASVELPASFSTELPSVFPVKKTFRDDLGEEWSVEASGDFSKIDFSAFSPLDYDGEPWNVSYADAGDVDGGAQVMLKLSEQPVVVSWEFGDGRVVWSGLNLPAHMERNRNLEEGKFLRLLLEEVVPQAFTDGFSRPEFESQFISSQKRTVSGTGARGVLFKELNFPGWSARVRADGGSKKLRIWQTGIGDPGMMWASIPESYRDKQVEIDFVFKGHFSTWLSLGFSSIVVILLFDSFAFNGKLFGALISKFWSGFRKRVGSWWERED